MAISTTWDLAGNTGTDPTKNFLGTTDGEPLVIETSGKERVYIDAQGNVGIGSGFGTKTPPQQKLQVEGNLHMDGNPIYLRKDPKDQNHGLQWYGGGRTFAKADPDGPVLFGWKGGALGSTDGGQQKIALRWNSDGDGNVLISGILDCGGPLRIGGDVVMNDHDVRLRGEADRNHGIGWYGSGKPWTEDSDGSEFPGPLIPGPDGPVIYGWAGGALGTMYDGQKGTALRWSRDGSVSVTNQLSTGQLFSNYVETATAKIGNATIDWDLAVNSIKSDYLDLNPKFPTKDPNYVSWPAAPEGIRISNQGYTGPPWVIFHNALDATDDYSLQFIHQRDPRKLRSGLSRIYFYENGNLEISGNVAAKPGGGEWGDTSDERLKTNIRPLAGALTDLLKLQGTTYEWKEPERHGDLAGRQIGFIGQDVEKVFPEWVSTGREGYKLLTIRGFSALSVEAFRELKNLCDGLRKRLDDLELTQSA
jgi:hypothetical protein